MSLNDVIRYYNDCQRDYVRVWGTDRNYSYHYGFYEHGDESHDEAADLTNRALAARIRVGPNSVAVDAGCGMGGTCIWLARHTGARVVGVNIHATQLANGRRVMAENGPAERVELVQADFARLPLASRSVDAVFAIEAICHAENKRAFMREVARVLKPGGRVVIVDYFLTARLLRGRERRRLARFATGWALSPLLTLAEWRALAHEAGMEHDDFEDVTRFVLPDSRRMARLCALSLPRTWCRVWRGTRSSVVLGNRLSGVRQYLLLTADVYRYGIFAARARMCGIEVMERATRTCVDHRAVGGACADSIRA